MRTDIQQKAFIPQKNATVYFLKKGEKRPFKVEFHQTGRTHYFENGRKTRIEYNDGRIVYVGEDGKAVKGEFPDGRILTFHENGSQLKYPNGEIRFYDNDGKLVSPQEWPATPPHPKRHQKMIAP